LFWQYFLYIRVMKITILATGKCKDKALVGLTAEYLKRVQPFLRVELVEVVGADAGAEEKAQLAKIGDNAFLIALDEKGKTLSTLELAGEVKKLQGRGVGEVIFLIGGADGISAKVRARADLVLSFGRLTLPHMLVRVVLAEQVYRVGTVLVGHPYHREG